MPIDRPDTRTLVASAERLHFKLSADQAQEMLSLMQPSFDAYDLIDQMPDNIPAIDHPRGPGVRPAGSDNPCNAWYQKTDVRGAPTGKLAGRTVALKDNISLAGVPMMNGSRTLEGFVPSFDATIVTRLLQAGATISGKATCEHFCVSGGSHTSDPGPVHNPRRHGYSAGGSSSGSAALVALGEVDMAIGGDQGGSIRIPSSFCGTYGMKPTHGLVPYTGVMPIEATLDHVGPITSNVRDNAVLLEVLAGADGLDPRQCIPLVEDYGSALDKGVAGMKIGVLTEGFALANMDPKVATSVRAAIARLQQLGASTFDVSVREHAIGPALWQPLGCEGLTMQMMHGNGMGFNWKGLYDVGLVDHHARWREQADDLSPTLKLCMLVGQHGIDRYQGRYYAKARNLARLLAMAYDTALADCDLLVMPTLPIVAQPLPASDAPLAEYVGRAFEMLGNTSPFNITGHPAMSIPCGLVDGLPVGLMLVGRRFAENVIYQAAAAFESSGDWQAM